MSDTAPKRKIEETVTYSSFEYTVQWWDGVEFRSHGDFETSEEAIGASRAQNRKREEIENGHVLVPFTRAAKITTVTIEEPIGI